MEDKTKEAKDLVLKTSLSDVMKQSGTDVVDIKDYFAFLDVDFNNYSNIQLSESAANRLVKKLRSLRTGTHAAVPLICGGPRCPIVESCPLTVRTKQGTIDNYNSEWPILCACPIESHVMAFRIQSYIAEYNVDVDAPSTLALISKLSELDIYEMRIDVQLASSTNNASSLLREEVGTIHQPSGTTYETIKIHPLWEIKNQIHKQRMELLDALIGTPKAKTKAAVSMGEKTEQAGDLAIEMSRLRSRLDIMQTHSRNGTLDADYVPVVKSLSDED